MSEDADTASVGIVIPLYNKASSIQRAIVSILNQEYRDFRVVIVDDGSTDNSLALARACSDPRITVVCQKNAGPAAARNYGASLCDAPLIAFLDADDEWTPDFLRKGCDTLARYPDCAAFVCGYDSGAFADVRPNKVKQLQLSGGYRPPTTIAGVDLKAYIDALHSSCIIVRHSVFDCLGGYYNESRVMYGEDSFLWIKLALAYEIFWTPEELTIFHVEDSELGFASKVQRLPRPISSKSTALRSFCPPEYLPALNRVIMEFVTADIRGLGRSGAFSEAANLRRAHGVAPIGGVVIDYLRFVKAKLIEMQTH
jgi:glycosyltransferase involved in cell wall biosynthesis